MLRPALPLLDVAIQFVWLGACGCGGTASGTGSPGDEVAEPETGADQDSGPARGPAEAQPDGAGDEAGASVPGGEPAGSAGASGGPGPSSDPDPSPNPSGTDTPTDPVELDCSTPNPGPSPVRRLSRFEYSNTVADLLGDATRPGDMLPAETGRYGNGADQVVSLQLAMGYQAVGEAIAGRAIPSLARAFPCIGSVTSDGEAACALSVIEDLGARAFRRALSSEDVAELVALQEALRADGSFEESIEWLVGAILQGPDFLYRLEFGTPDATDATQRRPSGDEMATRLSYLFWGTQPDPELAAAAQGGALTSSYGVRREATRLLSDQKARPVVRHFFDRFLGLERVLETPRDASLTPSFTADVRALMLDETRGFLEQEIFAGEGSWSSVLGAPRMYVNGALSEYYDVAAPPDGSFAMVEVDPATTRRRGLLTQGAILAGPLPGDATNPVRRGMFVVRDLLCMDLELPTDPALVVQAVPPAPDVAQTTRDRFAASTLSEESCATCHAHTDPVGFALENYDAVAVWRDQENGLDIDASGETELLGAFDGPFELIDRIVESEQTYACFARNWAEFAYGRPLDRTLDACTRQRLEVDFAASGYDVQALLLALTQTDAFLYLTPPEATP